jgi:hypothetical protein
MSRPTLPPTDAYRARATGPLGLRRRAGWTIKVTGITAAEPLGRDEVEAALRCAAVHLPQPPAAAGRSGIAFVVLHRGAAALWLILGWWGQDLLYQRVFRADLGTTSFWPVPPDGPSACVWELLVVGHERDAWVEHVLRRPDEPDVDGYLAATLSVEAAG